MSKDFLIGKAFSQGLRNSWHEYLMSESDLVHNQIVYSVVFVCIHQKVFTGYWFSFTEAELPKRFIELTGNKQEIFRKEITDHLIIYNANGSSPGKEDFFRSSNVMALDWQLYSVEFTLQVGVSNLEVSLGRSCLFAFGNFANSRLEVPT